MARAMAVNCRLHTTEARKPAAKANRIPLSNPSTVRAKCAKVIPPISNGNASMGKMASRPYTEASALEQSFPAMISALFRLVRNNKPRVPSRLSALMQSAVRAVAEEEAIQEGQDGKDVEDHRRDPPVGEPVKDPQQPDQQPKEDAPPSSSACGKSSSAARRSEVRGPLQIRNASGRATAATCWHRQGRWEIVSEDLARGLCCSNSPCHRICAPRRWRASTWTTFPDSIGPPDSRHCFNCPRPESRGHGLLSRPLLARYRLLASGLPGWPGLRLLGRRDSTK